MNAPAEQTNSQTICGVDDLIANSGVCALIGEEQIAVFYIPNETPSVYAIGNWDPIGQANVLSRGILGDVDGKLVVASPLYKQHFELATGKCLEDEEACVPYYDASIVDDQVLIKF